MSTTGSRRTRLDLPAEDRELLERVLRRFPARTRAAARRILERASRGTLRAGVASWLEFHEDRPAGTARILHVACPSGLFGGELAAFAADRRRSARQAAAPPARRNNRALLPLPASAENAVGHPFLLAIGVEISSTGKCSPSLGARIRPERSGENSENRAPATLASGAEPVGGGSAYRARRDGRDRLFVAASEAIAAADFTGYTVQYPPMTSWGPIDEADVLRAWRAAEESRAGLYVHVPYCPDRCTYCRYCSHALPDAAALDRYMQGLRFEIERYAPHVRQLRFTTLYVGGGTPTMLSESQMDALFDMIEGNFDLRRTRQRAVEATPATLTAARARVL